ncbi:MAG: hypothetical protein HKN82_18970, partial [Akkermansiaceae bacterium]|nr:hypothetical protein [Akkermansiaceae bacterium]
ERPLCRYDLAWEETYAMEIPQFFSLRKVIQAFAVRAVFRLASGDSAGAARDIITMHRLAEAGGRDPLLVGMLIGLAGHASALNVLWDGLDRRAFTDPELQELDVVLAGIDPFPQRLAAVLRMERAIALRALDELEANPRRTRAMTGTPDHDPVFRWGFSTWMSANRLGVSEDLQEAILAPGGTPVTRLEWKSFVDWERRIEHRWRGPRKTLEALATLLTPAPVAAGRRAYLMEAEIGHARLAIALERHRLATGAYPASLAALVPDFLPALPEDRINGRPVEYRLKPDGTPLLYQWGFDGDDDGGSPRKDPGHGDLVWQYSLPPGFTEADWRRKD